ncbi:hypothetical protein J6590_022303 [Homalodisca vitripennis]|nr:hypothetical protein J6590_022303 [Homalodisca vitripennis]
MDQVIFQQDGVPPYFANPIKRLLNDNLYDCWIGRGTAPRSPTKQAAPLTALSSSPYQWHSKGGASGAGTRPKIY